MDTEMRELFHRIGTANPGWAARVSTELHDAQYDCEADTIYITYGKSGDALSVPLDVPGEDVYLRVEEGTLRITGLDIHGFRKIFLERHPDAKEAFTSLFDFFGDMDWRFQIKPPTGEVALLIPSHAAASLQFFSSYIPRAAPELSAA